MIRIKLPIVYEHDEGSYSDDHCGDGRGKCHGKGVGNGRGDGRGNCHGKGVGDGGGGAPGTAEIEEYEVEDDTI